MKDNATDPKNVAADAECGHERAFQKSDPQFVAADAQMPHFGHQPVADPHLLEHLAAENLPHLEVHRAAVSFQRHQPEIPEHFPAFRREVHPSNCADNPEQNQLNQVS